MLKQYDGNDNYTIWFDSGRELKLTTVEFEELVKDSQLVDDLEVEIKNSDEYIKTLENDAEVNLSDLEDHKLRIAEMVVEIEKLEEKLSTIEKS